MRKKRKLQIGSDNTTSVMNMQLALHRDKFTCQMCGTTNASRIDVHHIDGKSFTKSGTMANNNLDNLITYCHRCHLRLHYDVIEKHADIVSRRAEGETLQSIADSYGVSRQRVFQVIQENKF